MKLLLDTHAFLWWLADSPRLGLSARRAIRDSATIVWVSAASAWEITLKTMIGRLDLGEEPQQVLPRELARYSFRELAVSVAHALAVCDLPPHHRDPVDRMLVAQAVVEQLTLVTADPEIARYDVAILPADA